MKPGQVEKLYNYALWVLKQVKNLVNQFMVTTINERYPFPRTEILTTDYNTFIHRSRYPCSAQELYNFHARPGALARLLPPWENTTVISCSEGITPGSRARVKIHTGPLNLNFEALHVEEEPGRMFRDIQKNGPFAHWSHTHIFHDSGEETILEDRIEYGLPGHRFIPTFIRRQIENKLTRLFRHRQQILTNDLAVHGKYSRKPLNILVTGAGGMLGRRLLPFLTTGGHRVWRLVRRRPRPDRRFRTPNRPDGCSWRATATRSRSRPAGSGGTRCCSRQSSSISPSRSA